MKAPTRKRHADRVLAWLRQVAEDRKLTDFTARVAIVLAQHGDPARIWIELSQQRLADECGATKTGVRKALAALIERCHLNQVQLGSNKAPTRYALRLHTAEMPIGSAMTVAPKRALKGATRVAHSSADYATAVAPPSRSRSSVMEAAVRDAELRERMRLRQARRRARS